MQKLKKAIKKNILAGLLVTVPAALTYMVLAFLVNRVDRMMAPIIPKLFGPRVVEWLEQNYIPGIGFLLIIGFIILVGLFATNFFGKKVVQAGELLLNKIPFVRAIYTSIKKVIDTLSQTETPAFQNMVLLTYPRTPLKTLGIVCCDTEREVTSHVREDMINIFVPTSPNPTTGFLLVLPKEDVIPLDMSVEDGLKMIISFGMVNPERDKRIEENVAGETGNQKA